MRDLRLCLYGTYEAKDRRHAQEIMRSLGITYLYAVPQSMADQWWFFCCENIPEELPKYISEMANTSDIHRFVGYGLSKEMADNIANKRRGSTGE